MKSYPKTTRIAAMSDQTKPSPRSGRAVSRKIAHTALDLFVDELMAELNWRGKESLDRHDINEIARAFREDAKSRYLPTVQNIAADWMAQVIRDHWEQNRRHPFERILVKRIAHLFPPSESLSDKRALSRRILPGSMIAFEGIAGTEFVNQCRAAGRGIFKSLREMRGEDFTWANFYNDQSANDLSADLLAVVAWSFREFDARLATDAGRNDIQKRYGDRGLSALTDLLRKLGAAT